MSNTQVTGAQIKAARQQLGMKQRELAALVGCSQSALGEFENGLRQHSTYASAWRHALEREGIQFDKLAVDAPPIRLMNGAPPAKRSPWYGSITPQQVSKARALLGWSQTDLCTVSGLHRSSVSDFEVGNNPLLLQNRERLRYVFEQSGITFTPDGGVTRGAVPANEAPVRAQAK